MSHSNKDNTKRKTKIVANPLFLNAVDSLKIGMDFYLKNKYEYSHKHAILTIFHSIELFLKEYLLRINPILIYKDIDKPITVDSYTVGMEAVFVRLENLKIGIDSEYKDTISKIQKRRNRIEHHRYEREPQDSYIIGEALKFITYFVEVKLEAKLSNFINSETLRKIEKTIFDYQELKALADYRLEEWLKEKKVPPEVDWTSDEFDLFDYFEGTVECPVCDEEFLVLEHLPKPYCFYCNKEVDATSCEDCGIIHLKKTICPHCLKGTVYKDE